MTQPHGEGRPAGNGAASKKNFTTTASVPRDSDIASRARHARTAQSRVLGSIVLATMIALVAGWVR